MSNTLTTPLSGSGLHGTLRWLLQTPHYAAALPSVQAWRDAWQTLAGEVDDSVALALRGGFMADRIGWAFAAGYQAALRALVPGVAPEDILALAATEPAGNRPRDIETRCAETVEGWRLDGHKSWITLGGDCTAVLVVARLADDDEKARPRLKVLRVPAIAAGLEWPPSPPLPFIPELPHSQCLLKAVVVPAAAMLPGDGYSDYVKPFRTIEDVFVNLAVLAYALREARARGWPQALQERLVAALCSLAALAGQHPASAATHVALAGALAVAGALYQETGVLMQRADDAAAARWCRDAPLFGVAGKARAARTVRAWEQLAGAG